MADEQVSDDNTAHASPASDNREEHPPLTRRLINGLHWRNLRRLSQLSRRFLRRASPSSSSTVNPEPAWQYTQSAPATPRVSSEQTSFQRITTRLNVRSRAGQAWRSVMTDAPSNASHANGQAFSASAPFVTTVNDMVTSNEAGTPDLQYWTENPCFKETTKNQMNTEAVYVSLFDDTEFDGEAPPTARPSARSELHLAHVDLKSIAARSAFLERALRAPQDQVKSQQPLPQPPPRRRQTYLERSSEDTGRFTASEKDPRTGHLYSLVLPEPEPEGDSTTAQASARTSLTPPPPPAIPTTERPNARH